MKKKDKDAVFDLLGQFLVLTIIAYGFVAFFITISQLQNAEGATMGQGHIMLEKTLIKKHEGFKSNIFIDTKGNRLVGFSFNLEDPGVRKLIPERVLSGDEPIDLSTANQIFDDLYLRAHNDAIKFVGARAFENLDFFRQYVLKDMAYNLGLTKLNKFHRFRKALQEKDFEKASIEMMASKWYGQVGERSKFLVGLMQSGVEQYN